MAYSWLRLWVEITDDPVMRRIDPAWRWVWITCLCMARRSARPGYLELKGQRLTAEDIADAAAVQVDVVQAALAYFSSQGMLDGEARIVNWEKRQPVRDDGAGRMRKMREGEKPEETIQGVFDQEIHPITPFEFESLCKWVDDGFAEAVIIAAIHEATRNEKRTLAYIEGILKVWNLKQLYTVEALEAYRRGCKSKGGGKVQEPVRKDRQCLVCEFYEPYGGSQSRKWCERLKQEITCQVTTEAPIWCKEDNDV